MQTIPITQPIPPGTIEAFCVEGGFLLIEHPDDYATAPDDVRAIVAARNLPQAPAVPDVVTMRQARLALLQTGVLAGVEAAIDGLPEPQRSAARIEWEYSGEVQRSYGLVSAMAPALGLTETQIDALFIAAAAL